MSDEVRTGCKARSRFRGMEVSILEAIRAEAAAALRAYVIGRWAGLPARLEVRLRRTHPNGANSLVADDGIPLAIRARSSRGLRAQRRVCLDFPIAVNGTLMRGLELNPRMLAVGGRFEREATTRPQYRLWSIDDRHPAMIRVREGGVPLHCSSAPAQSHSHWPSLRFLGGRRRARMRHRRSPALRRRPRTAAIPVGGGWRGGGRVAPWSRGQRERR